MLADAQKSKSKAKKKKKKESKKGRVQSLSHTLCCLLLFHSSSCYMPQILCCSVGHFDYFFGVGGGLSSARMLGLGVCGSVSVVWVGCMCSLLPYGTGFCCYLFNFVVVVGFCLFLFYRIFLEPCLSKSAGMVSGWCSANIFWPFFYFFYFLFFLKGVALNGLAA